MGNSQHRLLDDASWELNVIQQKKEWSDVELDGLFNSDFLELNFRGSLVTKVDANAIADARSTASVQGHAQQLLLLEKHLRASCYTDNSFTVQSMQRLFVLQWVQQAIREKYGRALRRSLSPCARAAGNAGERNTKSTESSSDRGGRQLWKNPSQSLVVELLSTMVASIQLEDPEHRAEFLEEISPLLVDLHPLSLVNAQCPAGRSPSLTKKHEGSTNLLDKIRDFLFVSATQRGTHEGKHLAPEEVAAVMKTRRTSIKALVALSLARGSLIDVLFSVKALLLASIPVLVDVPESADDMYRRLEASLPPTLATIIKPVSIAVDTPKLVRDRPNKAKTIAYLQSKASKMAVATTTTTTTSSSNDAVGVAVAGNNPHDPDRSTPAHSSEDDFNCWDMGGAVGFSIHSELPAEPRTPSSLDSKPVTNSIHVSLPGVDIASQLQFVARMDTPALMSIGGGGAETSFLSHSDACEVWTCGQNSYGELAHGDTQSRSTFAKVTALAGCDVAHVAAGNEHTVILLANGEVFTAGYNDNGQCGHKRSRSRVCQLSRVDKLAAFQIQQIHAYNGCEHTIVVDDKGTLLSFGYNYRGQLGLGHTTNQPEPCQMQFSLKHPVRLVACSYYHSVIVCDNRSATYAFGRNDFGQLGVGDTDDKSRPHRIHALDGQNIVSLACGQYHTVVSTKRGRIFSCGKNDYGQLGLRAESSCIVPALVDQGILRGMSAIDVKCGYYHTIVLCHSSSIVGFGRNDYGQLGLGHTSPRVADPQVVTALEGRKIRQVTAGCYHTIAVGKGGRLFVFGRNNHGQLGTGDTNERHVPFEVRSLVGKNILCVAAGFYHSVILVGGPKRGSRRHGTSRQTPSGRTDSFIDEFCIEKVLGQPKYQLQVLKRGVDRAVSGVHTTSLVAECKSHATSDNESKRNGDHKAPHTMRQSSTRPGSSSTLPGSVPSNNVRTETAAVILLGHLHRLANSISAHLESNCSIDSPEELTAPFCIDMNQHIFGQLTFLIRLVVSNDTSTKAQCVEDKASRVHIVLACLKLIKLNLSARQKLRALSQAHLKQDASDCSSTGGIAKPCSVAHDADEHNDGGGEACSAPPNVLAGVHKIDAPIVRRLHETILDLIQRPLHSLMPSATSLVRNVATQVLMAGLHVFYGSPEVQLRLLCSVVANEPTGNRSLDAEDGRCEQESPQSDRDGFAQPPYSFSEQVRLNLMGPILERLATDGECMAELVSSALKSTKTMHMLRRVVLALTTHLSKFWIDYVNRTSLNPTPTTTTHPASPQLPFDNASVVHDPERILEECANDEGVDGEYLSAARLYCQQRKFLMALQTYLVSVAGSWQHPSRVVHLEVTSDFAVARPCLHNMTSTEGDAAGTILGQDAASMAWTCLIQFGEVVLQRAVSTLHCVRLRCSSDKDGPADQQGCSATAPDGTTTGNFDSSGNNTARDEIFMPPIAALQIELSWIGRTIPALLSSLLLFSSNSFVAASLVSSVADLLRVLNRICTQAPFVVATAVQVEDAGTPHLASAPGSSPRTDSADAPCLPWLVQVTKTAALLAGQFAGTITKGSSIYSSAAALQSVYSRPTSIARLQGSLFQSGMRSSITSMYQKMVDFNCLLSGGIFEDSSLEPRYSPLLQRNVSTCSIATSIDSTKCETSCSPFINSIRVTESFAGQHGQTAETMPARSLLFQWLRERMWKSNMGYQLAFRKCRTAEDVAAANGIHRLECTIFASLVYHLRLHRVVQLWESKMTPARFEQLQSSRRNPPRCLMELWKFIAVVVRTVDQHRTAMERKESTSPNSLDVQSVCGAICKRVHVMLLLKPVIGPVARNCTAFLHQGSRAPSPAAKRWARLRLVLRSVMHWKSIQHFRLIHFENHDVGATINTFSEYLAWLTEPITSQSGIGTSAETEDLNNLATVLVDNARRAHWRQVGLQVFRTLLASVSFPSVQADLMRGLPLAMAATQDYFEGRSNDRLKAALRRHGIRYSDCSVLNHLDGVDQASVVRVKHQFHLLYRVLNTVLQELSLMQDKSREDWMTSVENGTSTTSGLVVHAGNYRLLASVARCWALRFDAGDLEFLSSVRIFDVLEHLIIKLDAILDRPVVYRGDTSDEFEKPESQSMVQHAQRTLWLLFEYLAVQSMQQPKCSSSLRTSQNSTQFTTNVSRVFLKLLERLFYVGRGDKDSNAEDTTTVADRGTTFRGPPVMSQGTLDEWSTLCVFMCRPHVQSQQPISQRRISGSSFTCQLWFNPSETKSCATKFWHVLSVQKPTDSNHPRGDGLFLMYNVDSSELQVWMQSTGETQTNNSSSHAPFASAKQVESIRRLFVDRGVWTHVVFCVCTKDGHQRVTIFLNRTKCFDQPIDDSAGSCPPRNCAQSCYQLRCCASADDCFQQPATGAPIPTCGFEPFRGLIACVQFKDTAVSIGEILANAIQGNVNLDCIRVSQRLSKPVLLMLRQFALHSPSKPALASLNWVSLCIRVIVFSDIDTKLIAIDVLGAILCQMESSSIKGPQFMLGDTLLLMFRHQHQLSGYRSRRHSDGRMLGLVEAMLLIAGALRWRLDSSCHFNSTVDHCQSTAPECSGHCFALSQAFLETVRKLSKCVEWHEIVGNVLAQSIDVLNVYIEPTTSSAYSHRSSWSPEGQRGDEALQLCTSLAALELLSNSGGWYSKMSSVKQPILSTTQHLSTGTADSDHTEFPLEEFLCHESSNPTDLESGIITLIHNSIRYCSAMPTVSSERRTDPNKVVFRRPTLLFAIIVRHVKTQSLLLCRKLLLNKSATCRRKWFQRLHALSLWRGVLDIANSVILCSRFFTVEVCERSIAQDQFVLHQEQKQQILWMSTESSGCNTDNVPLLFVSDVDITNGDNSLDTQPCATGNRAVATTTAPTSENVGGSAGSRSLAQFVCPFCSDGSNQRTTSFTQQDLVEHVMKEHSDNEGRQVLCPICIALNDSADRSAGSRLPVVPLYDFTAHLQLRHTIVAEDIDTFRPLPHDNDVSTGASGSKSLTESFEERDDSFDADDDDDLVDEFADRAAEVYGDNLQDLVDELASMGFPESWCNIALKENHGDMAAASSWIVDNLEMLSTLESNSAEDSPGYTRSGATTTDSNIKHESDHDSTARHDAPSQEGEEGHGNQATSSTLLTRTKPDEFLADGGDNMLQESFFTSCNFARKSRNRDADSPYNGGQIVGLNQRTLSGGDFVGSVRALNTYPSPREDPQHRHHRILVEVHQKEEACSIMYAREIMLAFICESSNDELQSTFACAEAPSATTHGERSPHSPLISNGALFQFLQLILFRGYTLGAELHHHIRSRTSDASRGAMYSKYSLQRPRRPQAFVEHPKPAGSNDVSASQDPNGYDPADPALHQQWLLSLLWPALLAISDAAPELLSYLADQGLSMLERAATSSEYHNVMWHARPLGFTDTAVVGAVNVELAEWLLRLAISKTTVENVESLKPVTGHVVSPSFCERLASNIFAGNIGVQKSVASIVALLLPIVLHARPTSSAKQGHDQQLRGAFDTCDEFRTTINSLLPISLLQSAIMKRVRREKAVGRIFFSSYLRAMIDLYVALWESHEHASSCCEIPQSVTVPASNCVNGNRAPVSAQESGVGVLGNQLLSPPQLEERFANRVAMAWNVYWPENFTVPRHFVFTLEFRLASSARKEQQTAFRVAYTGRNTYCNISGLQSDTEYECRVKLQISVDGNGDSSSSSELFRCFQSPVSLFTTGSEIPFVFDTSESGPGIRVSDDHMSAAFASNEMWSTILGTTGFVSGTNRWAIRIDRSVTAYIFIGVATKDADLCNFLGSDQHGWGFIGDKALYHQRQKVSLYGDKRFIQGDTIGVTLDMDRGTLSFTQNGVDLGVAFDEGLSGELFPAVAFYNRGQEVSLVSSVFDCPGAGVGISTPIVSADSTDDRGETSPDHSASRATQQSHSVEAVASEGENQESNPDFRLQDVVYVKQILHTSQRLCRCAGSTQSGGSATYPNFFAARCWVQYRKWAAGHTYRANNRLGVCMQFDVSRQRCRAFGFEHGDRVATPRGEATVVGVANHKLWFQIDDESGVWFFTSKELRLSKRLFVLLSRGKGNSLSAGSQIQTAKSDISQSSDRDATAPDSISFGEFCSVLHHPFFTPEDDGVLVDLVNEHCARDDSNPWNVSYDDVCGSISRDFATYCTTVGKNTAKLPHVAVSVRLTFLKCLNDLLFGILPAAELSEQNFESYVRMSPIPATEHVARCGGLTRPQFLSSGKHCDDLGSLVSRFRASLFYHTKRDILRTVVDRTATKLKRADDEYDYPDELPQIMLNRPKAAAATQRRDHVARLTNSMFGQMLDALHFLPPHIQRIAYTHPMDDAQQRNFKMKFEGEGVDDYGGPFREVFSQLSAELMATFKRGGMDTSSQSGSTAVSPSNGHQDVVHAEYTESGSCVLPLLQPTPNKAAGHGLDQESLMINSKLSLAMGADPDLAEKPIASGQHIAMIPSSKHGAVTLARLYRIFFYFLGQVMGVAMRNRVTFPVKLCSLVWKPLVGEALTAQDLFLADSELQSMLKQIRHQVAPLGDDMMEDADVRWETRLSDGSTVDLSSMRSAAPADFDDDIEDSVVRVSELDEFETAVVKIRLHECQNAALAMREGLCSIIPASAIALLHWKELRAMVAGRESINISLLRSCTEYDEDVNPDDDFIQYFWETLENFDDSQRSQFLRFVWARTRLPASKEEFTQKFKIQSASSAGAIANPDKYLPKAHTCFFSLSLPKYSSQAVLAEKLEYAMINCIEMDADFRLSANEMTGWDEADVSADDAL